MSASFDPHVHISTVNMFCQRALEILQKDHTSDNEIQVKSLEAIAEARSTLGMAAQFMYMSCRVAITKSGAEVTRVEQWKTFSRMFRHCARRFVLGPLVSFCSSSWSNCTGDVPF